LGTMAAMAMMKRRYVEVEVVEKESSLLAVR
jgi:hypothetical protein